YDETLNNGIARLLSTGAEHPSFAVGRGFSGEVLTVVEQPDGKLLVGGNFTSYDGEPYSRLIRLMPNGTPDSTFNIGTGANSEIHALAVQSDGRIIVGGNFSTFGGVSRN